MIVPHEKIKAERLKKNISQVEMANAAGMSRSAYINFEKNGSESLPLKSAVGIANKLATSFNELFQIESSGSAETVNEDRLKELQDKVRGLEKQIEKNDLLIESLENKIKDNAAKLIENIEEKGRNAAYWYVLHELRYSKSKEKKAEQEKLLETLKRQREGIYDFYLKEGIITQEDIQRTQEKIKNRYSKMFKQIYGDPLPQNEKNNSLK